MRPGGSDGVDEDPRAQMCDLLSAMFLWNAVGWINSGWLGKLLYYVFTMRIPVL